MPKSWESGGKFEILPRRPRGLTPDVAFAQARTLLQQGNPEEGLKLLTDASKGHEAEVAWRIQGCRLR